jgi:hypothetical protein
MELDNAMAPRRVPQRQRLAQNDGEHMLRLEQNMPDGFFDLCRNSNGTGRPLELRHVGSASEFCNGISAEECTRLIEFASNLAKDVQKPRDSSIDTAIVLKRFQD